MTAVGRVMTLALVTMLMGAVAAAADGGEVVKCGPGCPVLYPSPPPPMLPPPPPYYYYSPPPPASYYPTPRVSNCPPPPGGYIQIGGQQGHMYPQDPGFMPSTASGSSGAIVVLFAAFALTILVVICS